MGMFGLIQNFELFPARDTRYYKIYHIAVQSEHHLTSSLNSKFQFESFALRKIHFYLGEKEYRIARRQTECNAGYQE